MNNLKRLSIAFSLILYCTSSHSQQVDPHYLNETTPGILPKIFRPGKISTEKEFEFGAVFSNDNKEFFYATELDGKAETRTMKFQNGSWGPPSTLLTHEVYSYNDPFLTPDNSKLFFISNRSLSGTGPKKDYDIWYIERQGQKWSEPKNAGMNINSGKNEYYISFTRTGKMYYSSNKQDVSNSNNYDIYSSEYAGDGFQPSQRLGSGINTSAYEADVFVAPDESYLVFAANRPGGLGSGDLYVSFRNADGSWTPSKSLGDAINTPTDDFCPFVSPDGKYLFYASQGDIYWVSSEVIQRMR